MERPGLLTPAASRAATTATPASAASVRPAGMSAARSAHGAARSLAAAPAATSARLPAPARARTLLGDGAARTLQGAGSRARLARPDSRPAALARGLPRLAGAGCVELPQATLDAAALAVDLPRLARARCLRLPQAALDAAALPLTARLCTAAPAGRLTRPRAPGRPCLPASTSTRALFRPRLPASARALVRLRATARERARTVAPLGDAVVDGGKRIAAPHRRAVSFPRPRPRPRRRARTIGPGAAARAIGPLRAGPRPQTPRPALVRSDPTRLEIARAARMTTERGIRHAQGAAAERLARPPAHAHAALALTVPTDHGAAAAGAPGGAPVRATERRARAADRLR